MKKKSTPINPAKINTTKKLSIKDIALAMGVSTTTVSYVLNEKGREKRISHEVCERVLRFVKEKNYKPNHLAKSLRTGKTKIICLMVENIADPFFATLAGYIENMAYSQGYKIIYGSTENDTKKSKELIELFVDRQVDGFIITPANHLEQEIKQLQADGIPLVLFDRYYESVKCSYVGLDNYNGTLNAVNYLINQQYKNIVMVTLDSDQSQMSGRLSGYLDAIHKNQLKPHILRIPYTDVEDFAVSQIYEFLHINKTIDAAFFATNYLAFAGLEAINMLKLQIPDDIGVIAFDDHELFKLYRPTITSVTQPLKELASKLVTVLLTHMNCPETLALPQEFIIPAKFTIRDSSMLRQ